MPRPILLTFLLLSMTFLGSGLQVDRPKILIIGDSISLGYTPYVQEELKDRALVFHNPGNAQHTGTGLDKIRSWIEGEDWDIIHFNWGLWDLCYRHPDSQVQGNRDKIKGTITYPLSAYGKQLDSLVKIMKNETEAHLIFLTTTYIPKQEAGRFAEDAVRYNDLAKKIMKHHGVSVHDIYKSSRKIHQRYGKGDQDVHYLPEGYQELGLLVAKFISRELSN